MSNDPGEEAPVDPEIQTPEPEVEQPAKLEEPKEDVSGLKKALESERALRKQLEREAKQANKSVDEKLSDLAAKVESYELKELTRNKLKSLKTELAKDNFQIDEDAVQDMLDVANITRDNYELVIGKIVDRLKKPNTIITPELEIPNEIYNKPKSLEDWGKTKF